MAHCIMHTLPTLQGGVIMHTLPTLPNGEIPLAALDEAMR